MGKFCWLQLMDREEKLGKGLLVDWIGEVCIRLQASNLYGTYLQ